MDPQKPDPHKWRTLGVLLAVGIGIFVFGLFLVLSLLSYAGYGLDSSVLNFYPLMGGAGALFGLERWLAYESGGVNPFHER